MNRNKIKIVSLGISLITLLIAVYLLYANHRASQSRGWVPENARQAPFETSIMRNGQHPEDFELFFLEPDPRSEMRLKPLESRPFSVLVAAVNTTTKLVKKPPSTVYVNVYKQNRLRYRVLLIPFSMSEGGHVYSGNFTAPETVGDYQVFGEAEYRIYTEKDGKRISLEPFKKTTKGVSLHVR